MKRTQSQNQKVKLSLTDMWSLRHNEIDGGIEGYQVPKEIYLGAKEIIWQKERAAILKDPKQHRKGPKVDDAGNPLPPPKRPNFLDEVTKWAKSYYDKEKADKVIEDCDGKGHPLLAKPKPKEYKKIVYPDREFYIDHIIRDEKKKYKQLEDREEIIAGIVEKTKEWEKKQVPYSQKLKENYSSRDDKDRIIKSTFGKSLRATLVTEAEHLGEKIPFYNTYVKPDSDDDPKTMKKFFPSVSLIFLIKT
jgi:hypothetical protein